MRSTNIRKVEKKTYKTVNKLSIVKLKIILEKTFNL